MSCLPTMNKTKNIPFSKTEKVLLKVGRAINAVADIEKLLADDKFKRKLPYRQKVQAVESKYHLILARRSLLTVMNTFGRGRRSLEVQEKLFEGG